MTGGWGILRVGAVTAGLGALPPAAAAAPVAGGLAPCYTAGASGGVPVIPVSLSGGTPGAAFQLLVSAHGGRSGGLGSASGSFDAAGNAAPTLTDIYPPGDGGYPSSGRRVDLSVRDLGAGAATTPLGSILITRRALDLGFSGRGDNRAHWVSLSGTQFAGRRIYGFIVHDGRVQRRMYLGTANVCGYTRARETIAPRRTPVGRYVFYANAGSTLRRHGGLSLAYRVQRGMRPTATASPGT